MHYYKIIFILMTTFFVCYYNFQRLCKQLHSYSLKIQTSFNYKQRLFEYLPIIFVCDSQLQLGRCSGLNQYYQGDTRFLLERLDCMFTSVAGRDISPNDKIIFSLIVKDKKILVTFHLTSYQAGKEKPHVGPRDENERRTLACIPS